MQKMTTQFTNEFHTESTYKELLLKAISENGAITGYKGKLSQAAGCQSSYLSQVIGGNAHLTPDHAAGLADFWDLNESETSCFMDLVFYERAATPKLKQIIQRRIDQTRTRLSRASTAHEGKSFQIDEKYQAEFYLKWHMSAIYMLCTMKNFNSIKKIAAHLNLEFQTVAHAVDRLEQMDLIRKTPPEGFEFTHSTIFLFEGSPFRTAFSNSYRQLALARSDREQNPDNMTYTMLYTMSKETLAEFRALVLNFVKNSKEYYDNREHREPEDDLACLTIDFFKI